MGASSALSTADPSTLVTKASETNETSAPVPRPTPAQAHLHNKISEVNSKIVSLSHLKPSGFATAENIKQLNMVRFEHGQFLQDIVALLESKSVFVISVNDKSKVPIGVTAATKQAPLVMHVPYEI